MMEDLDINKEEVIYFEKNHQIVIKAIEAYGNHVKGKFFPWLTVCGLKAMVPYKQKSGQPLKYKNCPYLCPEGFDTSNRTYYKTEQEALSEGIKIAYKLISDGN